MRQMPSPQDAAWRLATNADDESYTGTTKASQRANLGDCARLTESRLTRACGDIIPHRRVAPQSPHKSPLNPLTNPRTKRGKRCKFFSYTVIFFLIMSIYALR